MRRLLLICFLIVPPLVWGQGWTRTQKPFSIEGFAESDDPFSGGVYIPKSEIADIDGDGDPDILIVQVDGRVTLYENVNGHRWVTDDFLPFDVGQWARFVDMDADGDLDVYTNRNGSFVAFYENVGSSQVGVFLMRDSIVTDFSGQAIVSENQSIPDFCDIDGDGDMDLFTGRSIGSLAFYENRGTPTAPVFHFITDHFQNILVISAKASSSRRHGASSIRFHDQDGDGDLDLFWGDFFSTGLYLIVNKGSGSIPDFDSIFSTNFPPDLATQGFNAPRFGDLSGSGEGDLLVSVLFREQDSDNLWFFEKKDGNLNFKTKNYLPQVDFGRYSAPTFVDLNGDSLDEMIVGTYSRGLVTFKNTGNQGSWSFESWLGLFSVSDSFTTKPSFGDLDSDGDFDCVVGGFGGRIAMLENIGSPQAPVFELSEAALGNIDVGNYSAPRLVDLDADDDLDLVVGDGDGMVRIFFNSGGITQPAFNATADLSFSTPGLLETVPATFDVDWDGDEDLIVGTQLGTLALFENTGDSLMPTYQLVTTDYGGVKTTQNASPSLVDWDGDGDFDLLLGNLKGGLEAYSTGPELPTLEPISQLQARIGKLLYYRLRSDGSPAPRFELLSAPPGMAVDSISGILRWTPEKSMIGYHTAIARAFNSVGADTAVFTIHVHDGREALFGQNWPNPASQWTLFPFRLDSPMTVKLIIYNILGQQVREFAKGEFGNGDHLIEWDLRDEKGRQVSNGVYFAVLVAGAKTKVKKFTILRGG